MYNEYFGLKEPPFSIVPDPNYLYMSDNHREAMAHLLYGINSDNGFVLLTGDVGTGKTTVCRCLLQQLPENSNIAFILNPMVTVDELLATICDELGIDYPKANCSNKVFIDNINAYLLDANSKSWRTVIIVEEAQNLRPEVLEQIRLLTNLETNQRKLLQIIMLGQPELNQLLSRPEMRQLKQRITARYHLGPLTKQDLSSYVLHRLSVAGVDRNLFPSKTMDRLFRLSGGIPRIINLLCDRALLGTYVQGKSIVDLPTLDKAACEVFGEHGDSRVPVKRTFSWTMITLLFIVCGTALAATYLSQKSKLFEGNKPEPRQLNASQWPADFSFDRDQRIAFKALFKRWQISYKEKGDACQQVLSEGLRCLSGQGSLNSIIKLNRPAVLRLFDDQGRSYYVALTGIKGQTAMIEVGDEARSVLLKDIEKRWFGDYTLLWRMPPNYRGDIRPGMKGRDVKWIDAQLSAIQGRKALTGETLTYDNRLVKQVKQFQQAEGLPPDGVLGPQTIIHLSNATGEKAPALVQRQGET
jgi:general secretion pathway protein A